MSCNSRKWMFWQRSNPHLPPNPRFVIFQLIALPVSVESTCTLIQRCAALDEIEVLNNTKQWTSPYDHPYHAI
jgi:hypothetical protein